MSNDDIAAAVLECVGGFRNVAGNSLCATRLRITLNDARHVDRNALHSIKGVLGIADRGASGIEVVFGPNLVKGVYRAFERLTGLFAEEGVPSNAPARTSSSNFQVSITPETPGRPQVQGSVPRPTAEPTPVEDDITNSLLEMLDDGDAPLILDDEEYEDELASDTGARLLVINGPNFSLPSPSQPNLYDNSEVSDLLGLCHRSALEAGFADCECYHSNHEGDLIDKIEDAYDVFDAIVINPGSYTHTSVALLDALTISQIPAVEVHLYDLSGRESFRQVSYVRSVCIETIMGLGIEGYRKAIFDLAEHLGIS